MYTVVKFTKDWADEFDCQDVSIVKGSIEAVKKDIEDQLAENSYACFGTNQDWDEGEIDISDFSFKEISDEDAAVIIGAIGKHCGLGAAENFARDIE